MKNAHLSLVGSSSKLSLAVLLAIGQFAISPAVLADSVREWSYWESAPPVEEENPNFTPPVNILTSEHVRFGNQPFDGIDLDQTGWVGYTLASNDFRGNDDRVFAQACFIECGGDETTYVAGDLKLVINNTGVPIGFNQEGRGFDTFSGGFAGSVQANGTFNGDVFAFNSNTANDGTSFDYPNSEGVFNSSNQFSDNRIETYSSILNNDENGQYGAEGSIYSYGGFNSTQGSVFIGKTMPLRDIAEQIRIGSTYSFNGYSQLGSNVKINVSFGNASWNGVWSQNQIHNGFSGAGKISGNTLTSTSIVGAGQTGLGFVRSGSVNGTLIGTFNAGANSSAGIIGKTVLNVVNGSRLVNNVNVLTTKTQGDIFSVTLGDRRKPR